MAKFITKKSLGQHFLKDEAIIANIINSAANLQTTNILEIGPGDLALTQYLIKEAKFVTAIEKDERLETNLKQLKLQHSNFNYIIDDALYLKPQEIITAPAALISNLPYNVGTQIFLNYLLFTYNNPNYFTYFLLMFQKEVALRITATPKLNNYGRLSIISHLLADCHYLFDVPKESFSPAPAVSSAVILVKPLQKTRYKVNLPTLEKITTLAFTGKRKTIRNSLKSLNIDFTALNIDPNLRAEEISVQDYCDLANYLDNNST